MSKSLNPGLANMAEVVPQSDHQHFLAQACKAAADPLRLQVLRVLRAESFGVLELCQILDLAQSKMSHHLKVLANAGLVATRREGNSIFYRRPLVASDDPGGPFVRALFESLDQLGLMADQAQRIKEVRVERAKSSHEFFAKNAVRFKEQQALITENAHYVANLRDLVKLTRLGASATVVELGPGEGEYLLELSAQFDHVVAVDNSPEMLALAKQRMDRAQANQVRFIQGELADALRQQVQGDLLVCNMVLHHIASPAAVFRDASRILTPEGYLLVVELCAHDQAWVRESCGDIWLGFEPEELQHWASEAQLVVRQSLFLGLRNGFQVQLHLFQKQK